MACKSAKKQQCSGPNSWSGQQLKASADRHGRGRAFELLLVDLFREAHFKIEHDPDGAEPRQTDLMASYGPDRFLIEAKWEQQPSDVSRIGDVWDRLRRTEGTVIGVIVSVAGFSATVTRDILRDRSKSILLLGEPELLRVLERPEELIGLLRKKREALVVHARVHLEKEEPPNPSPVRSLADVPATDIRLLDLKHRELPYIATGGEFGQFVCAQDLSDIDWVPGSGHGVSLDMSINPGTAEGIIDALYELNRLGWVSERPRWSIQQTSTNWHGVGARSFAAALRSWEERTGDMLDAHHTEEVAYYDTCAGGYFSLTAGIAHHPSRFVYSCDVSFQLVGVPLDTYPIQHLCEALGVSGPIYFRPRAERAVIHHWHRVGAPVSLEPVGYVVAFDGLTEKEDWVTGIVARNPYREDTDSAPEGWPAQIARSEQLICDLRSHHQLSKPRSECTLFNWQTKWTSSALVVRIVADW